MRERGERGERGGEFVAKEGAVCGGEREEERATKAAPGCGGGERGRERGGLPLKERESKRER